MRYNPFREHQRRFDQSTKWFSRIFIAIVCLIFVAIVTEVVYLAISTSSVSVGPAGLVETRCINGLTFIIGPEQVRQVLGPDGKPIACQE